MTYEGEERAGARRGYGYGAVAVHHSEAQIR